MSKIEKSKSGDGDFLLSVLSLGVAGQETDRSVIHTDDKGNKTEKVFSSRSERDDYFDNYGKDKK